MTVTPVRAGPAPGDQRAIAKCNGRMPHAHAGHIGDCVPGAGWQMPKARQAQVAGARLPAHKK